MFNGIRTNGSNVYLNETKNCGANLAQLTDMEWVRDQSGTLDCVFSYDFDHFDSAGNAHTKPVYRPSQLAKT